MRLEETHTYTLHKQIYILALTYTMMVSIVGRGKQRQTRIEKSNSLTTLQTKTHTNTHLSKLSAGLQELGEDRAGPEGAARLQLVVRVV